MIFTDFILSEKFKLFPTGKVENKIKQKEAKEKEQPGNDGVRARNMRAVKNFRTKLKDDPSVGAAKAWKGDTLEYQSKKHEKKEDKAAKKGKKHLDKRDKEGKKGKYEKSDYHQSMAVKNLKDADKHGNRRKALKLVTQSWIKSKGEDINKQGEHNQKVKDLKRSMQVTKEKEKAEKSLKAKPQSRKKMKAERPKNTIKKEELFTDFLNDLQDPLYEVNEMPKCPVGYKWNPKTMRCEPKTAKDEVGGPKGERSPHGAWTYNVIGSSGYDGGWAFQEPPTQDNMGGGE